MRIGLVSSEYPPFSGGGIGTYSAITARALAAAGHEVHVVANAWVERGRRADRSESFRGGGRLVVHPVAALDRCYRPVAPHDRPDDPLGWVCRGRDCSLFWSFLAAERLAAVHREADLEVVEMPECFAEAWVALARRGRVPGFPVLPVTLTLHSPIREIAEHNLLRRTDGWVERRGVAEDAAIRQADTLVSPSRRLAEMVAARLGLDPDTQPVRVIPNAMDLDAVDRIARTATPPADAEPRLVFAGRLEPRKGVVELVDAVVPLLAERPRLVLELVGRDSPAGARPGSMRALLEARVPAALSDRVRFRGPMPREELLGLFASATACVFPPLWDNFPYTCCEAMAMGGAVVVTATTGMAEMAEDGRSGLVVPPFDPEALAAALRRLLDEPGLGRDLGRAAAARIRHLCDPARIIPERLELYRETVDRRRSETARRAMIQPHALPRPTLAVLVSDRGRDDELAATAASLIAAADRAGLELELTLASDRADVDRAALPPHRLAPSTTGLTADDGLGPWLEGVRATAPELLLHLAAGETVGEDYLEIVRRSLALDDEAAWATTWSLTVEGAGGEPFAGLDFAAPLDLMYHHPVPFAVLRRDRFEEAGGWNLALPAGWREWDLALALHGRGWRGLVVPVWAARHLPLSGRPLTIAHGKAYEMVLEAIVARNRELFREHGATLWIAGQVERLTPPCPPPLGAEPGVAAAGPDGAAVELTRQPYLDLVRHLADAEAEAPEGHVGEAAFFDAHPLGGLGLLAHPPARLIWTVDLMERAFLNLTLAVHPAVYEQPGGGVRFLVTVDDEPVLDDVVDPKRQPAHRGWKDLSLDLGAFAGPARRLELCTEAVPEDSTAYCTAGWGRAHLASEPNAPGKELATFRMR